MSEQSNDYLCCEEEDKWVVLPEDMVLTANEIKKSVHFIEQFFQTEYYCLYT
jgi:hypothetical protein